MAVNYESALTKQFGHSPSAGVFYPQGEQSGKVALPRLLPRDHQVGPDAVHYNNSRFRCRIAESAGFFDQRVALCYDTYKSDIVRISDMANNSVTISMRLPTESGKKLKRMANQHGWTTSDASARLVEEGLRRSEFAFIDFRDSPAGRQAYIQGSSLAVWEIMLVARDYGNHVAKVAKHLEWPETKVQAAINYAKAFPEEISTAIADNDAIDFEALSKMLPQTKEFIVSTRSAKR
jgi:hypothetical protein